MQPENNPVHGLTCALAVALFSTIWEGNYSPRSHSAPGEDELYDVVADAAVRALADPEIQSELRRALRKAQNDRA